jgi:hypothetical protein
MEATRHVPDASELDHRALGYSYDCYSLVSDLVAAKGRVALLRVHDKSTKYELPLNQLDMELIVYLDGEPGRALGFQLRADANEGAHQGLLDVLRNSFNRERRVRIDYVHTGSRNSRILLAMPLPETNKE